MDLIARPTKQPTAKEAFLETIVDHLLDVGGPQGAIVPWHNLRKDLLLEKVRESY